MKVLLVLSYSTLTREGGYPGILPGAVHTDECSSSVPGVVKYHAFYLQICILLSIWNNAFELVEMEL